MVGPVLVAALGRHVEEAVDAEELFAAAAVGGVGVENLACVVLVEDAVAREILYSGRPFWSWLKIIESFAGRCLFGPEGYAAVVVEVAAVRGNPRETPPHAFADDFDFLDRRASHRHVRHIVISEMLEEAFDMVHLERAADALLLRAGPHHEMLDEKLAAAAERSESVSFP